MATTEQAVNLIRQYDDTLLRMSRADASSPEAVISFGEHVKQREALIDLVSFALAARNAPPVVDVEPSTQDLDVDTATFGTVTELFA